MAKGRRFVEVAEGEVGAQSDVPEVSVEATPVVAPKKKEERRFVVQSRVVDKFNIRRVRIEVTPAVCTICGWDAAAAIGIPYADMQVELQAKCAALVEEHKKKVHDKTEARVLRESELPTEYLGFDS